MLAERHHRAFLLGCRPVVPDVGRARRRVVNQVVRRRHHANGVASCAFGRAENRVGELEQGLQIGSVVE
jgi:hypothetical protein